MSTDQAIQKGLKHLGGSDEIIGNIVAYCVNAHKADPSTKTMDKIRQYVTDTANSVCGHVLTIAHNINSIIDKESKEIEEMSYQLQYVQHRIKSHQTYMSELYMTKFQTLPRPKPTIHILRETIPTDQLPKFARPKRPWVRSDVFDYTALDGLVGKRRKPASTASKSGENEQIKATNKKAMNAIAPKAAVAAFNPYASMMNDNGSSSPPTIDPIASAPPTMSAIASAPSPKSLYQQQKEKAALKKKLSAKLDAGVAPPSFSAAVPPPSFSGAAPPSFSSAYEKPKPKPKPKTQPKTQPKSQPKSQPKAKAKAKAAVSPKPPQPPSVPVDAVPPPVPALAVPPPVPSAAVPPPVPNDAGPPPVPPVPPATPPVPPPVPPVPPQ